MVPDITVIYIVMILERSVHQQWKVMMKPEVVSLYCCCISSMTGGSMTLSLYVYIYIYISLYIPKSGLIIVTMAGVMFVNKYAKNV